MNLNLNFELTTVVCWGHVNRQSALLLVQNHVKSNNRQLLLPLHFIMCLVSIHVFIVIVIVTCGRYVHIMQIW